LEITAGRSTALPWVAKRALLADKESEVTFSNLRRGYLAYSMPEHRSEYATNRCKKLLVPAGRGAGGEFTRGALGDVRMFGLAA